MTGQHPAGTGIVPGTNDTRVQADQYDFTEVAPFAALSMPEPAAPAAAQPAPQVQAEQPVQPRTPGEQPTGHAPQQALGHTPQSRPESRRAPEPRSASEPRREPELRRAPEQRRAPSAPAPSARNREAASYHVPGQTPRQARPQSQDIRSAAVARKEQADKKTSLALTAAIAVVVLVIVVLAILILTSVVPFPGL